MGTSLNNLAVLYRAQGQYAEAEPLYQRAMAIRKRVLGPERSRFRITVVSSGLRITGTVGLLPPLQCRILASSRASAFPNHHRPRPKSVRLFNPDGSTIVCMVLPFSTREEGRDTREC